MNYLIVFFILGFAIGYWNLNSNLNIKWRFKKWLFYIIKVIIIFIFPYAFYNFVAMEGPADEYSAWAPLFISLWFLSGLVGLGISGIVKIIKKRKIK